MQNPGPEPVEPHELQTWSSSHLGNPKKSTEPPTLFGTKNGQNKLAQDLIVFFPTHLPGLPGRQGDLRRVKAEAVTGETTHEVLSKKSPKKRCFFLRFVDIVFVQNKNHKRDIKRW